MSRCQVDTTVTSPLLAAEAVLRLLVGDRQGGEPPNKALPC
jgi:hypothetical protein